MGANGRGPEGYLIRNRNVSMQGDYAVLLWEVPNSDDFDFK